MRSIRLSEVRPMFTDVASEIELGRNLTNETRQPVRALVADDFPHMQQALVACVQTIPGIEVVATALNGQEALDKANATALQLAIIDLQMPVMDGFKLLRELRRVYPAMYLVAVSGHSNAAVTSEAIAAGADVFVSKNELPFGLVSAVEKLLQ